MIDTATVKPHKNTIILTNIFHEHRSLEKPEILFVFF